MVVQTCNPSPQKVKAGRLGVQRHPQGHNEFEGSLLRPCLKKQNKQNKLPELVAKTPKNFQWKKIRGKKIKTLESQIARALCGVMAVTQESTTASPVYHSFAAYPEDSKQLGPLVLSSLACP